MQPTVHTVSLYGTPNVFCILYSIEQMYMCSNTDSTSSIRILAEGSYYYLVVLGIPTVVRVQEVLPRTGC
eukprot:COSAG02_NODE_2063_length_9965_cov_116.411920_1_plen_70_part_00